MINLSRDEELQEVLKQLISAVLPHENYKPKMFSSVVQSILNHIRIDEFFMEYYVMMSMLADLRESMIVIKGMVPKVTREIFESNVSSRAMDLVSDPNTKVSEWSKENAHAFDPRSEINIEEASTRLYKRCLDLYDDCYALKVDTESALTILPTLKSLLISNISYTSVESQNAIINGAISQRVGQRFKTYSGPEGWLEYIRDTYSRASSRLEPMDMTVNSYGNISNAMQVIEKWELNAIPIAKYNLEPFDNTAPIRRHWYSIIVANPGVGKTAWAVMIVNRMIHEGKHVLVMLGETTEELFIARYISQVMFEKYGLWIGEEALSSLGALDEDVADKVRQELLHLMTCGYYHTIGALPYRDLYSNLKSIYEEIEFEALVIDHSAALSGGRNETEDLTNMSYAVKTFKKDYPVHVTVMSHMSAAMREMLSKGQIDGDQNAARGSSNLTNDADEIKMFVTNDDLKRQELIAVQTRKIRGPKPPKIVMLKYHDSVGAFEFDPKDQGKYSESQISKDLALEKINSKVGEDEDEDEDDDDQQYWVK